MSDQVLDTSLIPAPAGRSIWANALLRLSKNRAAIYSLYTLGLMICSCFLGPLFLAHSADTIYRAYVKTVPSFTAHPSPDVLEPTIARVAMQMHVQVSDIKIADGAATMVLQGTRPVDERVLVYFERSDIFHLPQVLTRADDGKTLTISAPINYLLFPFGTDDTGHDLLVRTLSAGRISLLIGLFASFIALVIGVAWGAVAGYVGGRTDLLMMRVVEILYSLPFIFFVIMLVAFFGRDNIFTVFFAIGAVEWLDMARIVRGQTLAIKRQEYVQAAEALGATTPEILRRHVIPNMLGTIVVYLTLMIPKVILLESFLSFLGLGVQEPRFSWGVLIADGARNIESAPYLLIFPSIFLIVTLFSLNFIGDGLRDALDPKDR